jgi:hypothetical protein
MIQIPLDHSTSTPLGFPFTGGQFPIGGNITLASVRLVQCDYHCCQLPCFGCWLRSFSDEFAQELAYQWFVLPALL